MTIFDRVVKLFGGEVGTEVSAAARAASGFTLKDIEGKSYSLAEALKQGPVLLAFFKVSCPTCQFTLPFLERLHQATKDGDHLQIWGISQDDAGDTRAFAREYECTFPLLLDESGYPVSNEYGLTNVPTLYLVNPAEGGEPAGLIQLCSVGFDRQDIETVAAEFSRRSGQPISVFQAEDHVPDSKPG